ncbi:YcxB family protein [Streptosporangium sp. V21-05]|uniref:YcxB family protein n=1 Tax=Streptosporangium sp. V21-05 TaxID=3446115 RepID=UPI003F534293
MDVAVSYEPTLDEVARALGQGIRQQLKIAYLALPSVLIASGLGCVLIGSTSTGVAMLVGAVAFPLVLTWSIRRTGRRRLAHLCVPTTLRLTGDGYECHTDQATTTMRWSLFGRIVTGPEFWLFFVNRQFTGFLPRRAFSGGQQAEFDDFIASRRNTMIS